MASKTPVALRLFPFMQRIFREGVSMNLNRGAIPLLSKEGRLRAFKKWPRSSLAQPGWFVLRDTTTPAAPAEVASRYFLGRVHPSLKRRGMAPRFRFAHTFK